MPIISGQVFRVFFFMNDIFTARQRSCGKIMFSRASVCSGGGRLQEHHMYHGIGHMVGYPLPSTSDLGSYLPLVLTSSGGHRNTYGWQAGGDTNTRQYSSTLVLNPTAILSHSHFVFDSSNWAYLDKANYCQWSMNECEFKSFKVSLVLQASLLHKSYLWLWTNDN